MARPLNCCSAVDAAQLLEADNPSAHVARRRWLCVLAALLRRSRLRPPAQPQFRAHLTRGLTREAVATRADLTSIFLPTVLMLLVTWGTFFMDAKAVPARTAMCIILCGGNAPTRVAAAAAAATS